MTRESRTLLAVGLLAVAGVTALGIMASRYSKMQPLKSVEDVAPEPPVIGAAADEPAELMEPAGSTEPAGTTEADQRSPAGEQAPPALDPVDAFIEVRKAVVAAVDADPGLKHRMVQELSGQAREAPSRVHYRILIDVKFARDETCERLGIPVTEYQRVRESFIAWMGNEFAGKPPDPALVPEFERRRAELEPLYLGLLETVDEGR